jgi:hypothetical protein
MYKLYMYMAQADGTPFLDSFGHFWAEMDLNSEVIRWAIALFARQQEVVRCRCALKHSEYRKRWLL